VPVICASSPLKKECATACLQAVLLLLGRSIACKQAVAHIMDKLAVFRPADSRLGLGGEMLGHLADGICHAEDVLLGHILLNVYADTLYQQ
jgi:hypothetical protein